jgi:hypothetical protein
VGVWCNIYSAVHTVDGSDWQTSGEICRKSLREGISIGGENYRLRNSTPNYTKD